LSVNIKVLSHRIGLAVRKSANSQTFRQTTQSSVLGSSKLDVTWHEVWQLNDLVRWCCSC